MLRPQGRTATRLAAEARPLVIAWALALLGHFVASLPVQDFDPAKYFRHFLLEVPGCYLFSVFLIASAICLVTTVVRRPMIAGVIVLYVVSLISLANVLKTRELNQVLVTADFYFLAHLGAFRSYLSLPRLAAIVLPPALAAAALVFGARRFRVVRRLLAPAGRSAPLVQGALGLAVALVIALDVQPLSREVMQTFGLTRTVWMPSMTVERDGLLTSLLVSIPLTRAKRPDGLTSLDSIKLVSDAISNEIPMPRAPGDRQVAVIMLESWIDPAWINLPLNMDPTPNFHRLQREGEDFRIISPTYGAGTSNVEFEALTGLSTNALPPGMVPYLHAIRQPMISVASSFRQKGYESLAYHNFIRTFWHRNVAYPLMGFTRFSSIDDAQGKVEEFLGWPVDRFLYDLLLEDLQAPNRVFGFAVTAMTHGSYTIQLPESERIVRLTGPIKGVDLDGGLANSIEVYLNKLHAADRYLGEFIERARSIRGLRVLMFADHQPNIAAALRDNFELDRILSRAWNLDVDGDGDVDEEDVRLRIVPGVVWSSDGPTAGDQAPTPKLISASCLAPLILSLGGVEPRGHLAVVSNLCRAHDVIGRRRQTPRGYAIDDGYRNMTYDAIYHSERLLGAGE